MRLIDIDDIRVAADRIDGQVARTPLLDCEPLTQRFGCRVLVKAESLQRTGSFKSRGALNTLLTWREQGRLPERVVSFSAGNHAAAVAYAGRVLGVAATIAMPSAATQPKIDNVRRYGGEIVPTDDLLGTCAELAEQYGCPVLYPFDQPEVIAGQGTAGAEIVADVAEPDLVLVPVGGGGLLSGVATAVRALAGDCRVVGVEPETSDAVGAAMRAGRVVRLANPAATMADGLAAPAAGEHTLAQVNACVDAMATVDEAAIAEAWPVLVDATRLVLEPSVAVVLAALETGAVDVPAGGTVVLVASGGNAQLRP